MHSSLVLFAMLLVYAHVLGAQRVGVPTDRLTSLNPDELFQIQVSSVGRKAQELSRAPAAVFVLTADDIRRSGATSIPEALQWVPGLTVLPIDGRSWAISSRESARLYADKILVMVDGRSLYTPLFSGVIWDFLNVPLENIEQIEIVRGPSSVMWGPNAVNGVINIITRKAKQSTSTEIGSAVGSDQRGAGFGSWSSAPSEKVAYRVWGKVEDRNPAFSSQGGYLFNGSYRFQDPRPVESLDSKMASVGMRLDSTLSAKDQLMLQVDAYGSGREEMLGYPIVSPGVLDVAEGRTTSQGGSAQVRWTRTSSPGNEKTLQFTFDKQNLNYPFVEGRLNNLAVDYQVRRQTGETNEIYWGAGYQQYWDDTDSRRFVGFRPSSDVYRIANVTIRDEWQLVPRKLLVSVGGRVDYSSATRFEFQPSARLLYTPSTRQSLWLAASRAARMPNRFDRDMQTDPGFQVMQGIPFKLDITGSTKMRSETVVSTEAGYRFQSGQRWSVDTSVFWSHYPRLRVLQISQQPTIALRGDVPMAVLGVNTESSGTGTSYGTETWVTWRLRPGWRLSPSYSYLNEQQSTPAPSPQFAYAWLFSSSGARHQSQIRSQHDFGKRWQLDLMARGRSRNSRMDLPGLVTADVRLAFKATTASELSFTLRNLTDRQEFATFSEAPFLSIPTRRTFTLKWTVRL